MSGRPTLYTTALAERILDGLTSGRSLNAVCSDDGMPPPTTVLEWVRHDRDGFAARYRNARGVGNGVPLTIYSDVVAERLLEELRRGRALGAVCGDDGMPAVRTVARWVENDREGFAVRYFAARAEGHALMKKYTCYTPLIAELMLDELCRGRTLNDVCEDPGMPSVRTVHYWIREDREGFRKRYYDAREIGYYTMADQVHDIADDDRNDRWLRENKDGSVEFVSDPTNVRRSELRCDSLKWLLTKMLPKQFGHRPNQDISDEDDGGWRALLKAVDGQSRGLPNMRRESNQTSTG